MNRRLIQAPLPKDKSQPLADDERAPLRYAHAALIADREEVAWTRIRSAEPDEPPLVRLTFKGTNIRIDELWCRYFWSQIHPERGRAWLARVAFFEPEHREVYLKPRQEVVSIEAAMLWDLDARDNPLAFAKVGFIYLHPGRTLLFTETNSPFIH